MNQAEHADRWYLHDEKLDLLRPDPGGELRWGLVRRMGTPQNRRAYSVAATRTLANTAPFDWIRDPAKVKRFVFAECRGTLSRAMDAFEAGGEAALEPLGFRRVSASGELPHFQRIIPQPPGTEESPEFAEWVEYANRMSAQ